MATTTSGTEKRQSNKRKREEYDSDSSENEFYELQTNRVVSDNHSLTVRIEDSVGFTTNLKSGIRCVRQCTASEPDYKADIHQSLSERYQRSAHVEFNEAGMPYRYCFYDKGDKINEDDLFAIKVKFNKEFGLPLFKRCNERWTNLSDEGKVLLHRLLHLPVSMAGRLQFSGKTAGWKKSSEVITPVFNYLKTYGVRNLEGSVMDFLSKGKSIEQMEPLDHITLLGDWISALTCGMTNGEARMAVYDLLYEISALMPHLDIDVPVVIYHITSTAERDAMSISSSSSCSGSSSKTTPASKCQKLDEQEGNKDQAESKEKSAVELDAHRHFVDLAVAAFDDVTHFSKYLTLIEVHSRGKTWAQAESKFLTEIISVLQSQNAIFGFLFASEQVVIYHAKRKPSGKIHLYKFEYPLCGQSIIPSSSLNIAYFQLLTMDILSSLIYGIEKIRV